MPSRVRATHPRRINFVRLSPSADVLSRALAAFATHDLDAESALVIADSRFDFAMTFADRFDEEFTELGGRVTRTLHRPGLDPRRAIRPLRERGRVALRLPRLPPRTPPVAEGDGAGPEHDRRHRDGANLRGQAGLYSAAGSPK